METNNMIATHSKKLAALGVLALSTINPALADHCSRSDIDHYLDKEFSLPQIMKLCGDTTPSAKTASKTEAEGSKEIPLSNLQIFLQTAIDAEKVKIAPDAIIIQQERCFPYGEEGFTGVRPSACLKRTIDINRTGLKIGEVVESRFIFRDGKLIVNGHIEQTFDKLNTLKKRERKEFLQKYPQHMQSFDVPVKKSMKRQEVADALKKLAK